MADSQSAIMAAHLEKTPVPPITVDPRLPQALNDVILLSVAKDPNARFQTARAFRNALTSVVPARGASGGRRGRRGSRGGIRPSRGSARHRTRQAGRRGRQAGPVDGHRRRGRSAGRGGGDRVRAVAGQQGRAAAGDAERSARGYAGAGGSRDSA